MGTFNCRTKIANSPTSDRGLIHFDSNQCQFLGPLIALHECVKKILLCLMALSFLQISQAQVSCGTSVNSKSKSELQINYKEKEVLHFIKSHNIIPERFLNPIVERVSAFRFQNEDMGNALFASALSALGPRPSPQRDLLIQKFLAPLFDHYQAEFQNFTSRLPKGWPLRVHNLFELSKLGFKPDAYGTIQWRAEDSVHFLSLMKAEFSKKSGFDLIAANRLLVQMAYLHSSLSGNKKMMLSDLKAASDDFFLAEKLGHTFIPTIGEWDLANVTAQWHLRATVNMLPKSLNGKIQVHGGDGLSSIEGITHDHSHLVRWRLGAVAKSLGFNVKSSETFQSDAQISKALERALKKATHADREMLGNTVFFFVHEPEPLQLFIQKNQFLKTPEQAQQFAKMMRETLEKNSEFYPMMKNRFADFESAAAHLVQLIAIEM